MTDMTTNNLRTKELTAAIEAGQVLYWQRRWKEFEIRAVTYTWESGRYRSKRVAITSVFDVKDLERVKLRAAEIEQEATVGGDSFAQILDGFYDEFREIPGGEFRARERRER